MGLEATRLAQTNAAEAERRVSSMWEAGAEPSINDVLGVLALLVNVANDLVRSLEEDEHEIQGLRRAAGRGPAGG